MESLGFLAVMLSTILSGTEVSCAGSVVLTQTHPDAPYVCRTGSITLRCQYGGVENVLSVLWAIGNETTNNLSTIPGHTALPHTTTYREVGVDSYTNLAAGYRCTPILSNGSLEMESNQYNPQYEYAEVNISNLTLARRTATTLTVTWSAGYPKCYSFTVSHSTQDGSITVTQPANSDTSHTLTSLQPGTTYRIEVEAVRKGDEADGQRIKVIGSFATESEDTTDVVPSKTISPTTTLPPSGSSETVGAGVIAGATIGVSLALVLILVVALIVAAVFLVHRRKTLPDAKASTPTAPSTSQNSVTPGREDTKQTYAVLDWQNPDQRPVKAPDNEWFTVQYSEVHFAGTK